MNEKKQTNYPKGHFPVSISVEDKNTSNKQKRSTH